MSKIRLTHSPRNVVLVGHMGSGKTSIGKKLSKKIEFKFIDTDEEIEKKIKMTISEFFINNSERKFRNLEEEIVKIILSKNTKSIIAFGGGAFENKKIRSITLDQHFSVWLKCNLNTLAIRCGNRNQRPLLNNKNIKSELKNLDKKRKKNYMKSNLIIDVSKKTKNIIATEIIGKLDQYEKKSIKN